MWTYVVLWWQAYDVCEGLDCEKMLINFPHSRFKSSNLLLCDPFPLVLCFLKFSLGGLPARLKEPSFFRAPLRIPQNPPNSVALKTT